MIPDNFNIQNGSVPVEYLLQNLPFGMIIIDAEYKVRWINENIFRFSIVNDFAPDDVNGRNIMEVKFFKNAAVLKELVRLKNGENFEKKIPHDVSDPDTLFTSVKGRPLYNDGVYSGGLIILEQFSIEDKLVKEEYFRSENLNGLLQNLYDAYFITDSAGSIKHIPKWNNREEFNFPAALMPRRIFDIFPGNSSLRMKAVYNELNFTKERKSEDLVYPRFEGDLIFNAVFTPYLDAAGEVVFVMVLVKDVTVRRHQEKKLEEENHELTRYRIIASKMPDSLVITDITGRIKIWNESAASLFGLDDDPGYKSFVGDYISTFNRKYFSKIISEINRSGRWENEITLLNNNTELIYLSVRMSIFYDDGQALVAIMFSNITQRARNERRLKENELKFREIVTNTRDLICTFDCSGKINYINPPLAKLLGKPDFEINELPFTDLFIQPGNANELNIPAWDTNPPRETELFVTDIEGKAVFVNAGFSVVSDLNGDPKYYIAVLTDITDKKESEKELSTLNALLEASPDGIAVHNEKEFVVVNDNFAGIFGYDFKSEVIGKNPTDFIAEEDRNLLIHYFSNLRKTRLTPGHIEFKGRKKNGELFFIELTGKAYQSGSDLFIISIIKDITKRKSAEKALRVSEEKYKTVTDRLNVSIWSAEYVDNKARVLFYTPAILNITGYSEAEFLSDEGLWTKILHPDELDRILDRYNSFIANPKDDYKDFEYRILSKAGNIVWISNKINVIRKTDGTISKLYGIITDITSGKKAEDELKRSADDLKKLNETKDRFISIISHDLRTPFSSILGYTDLLLSGRSFTEDKRNEYIGFIRESSTNMLSLVNSLLDWTRLQTGRMKFEPARINARDVINKTIQMLSGNALKKDIELFTTIERDFFVHADENLLLQAFMNLVSNAVKFTNNGGRVIIGARPVPANKEFEFTVEDNGTGISAEDLEKLFKVDAKFTLKGTAGEKGSGLGLSLVQEIVEKHGGQIRVESLFGKGSKFIFTIPVSSAKILLVDDSNTDRILYTKLLTNLLPNYKIIEASNGEQAFASIVNSSPAVVITSHIMPQKTGLEMVKQLASSPLKFKPPVIVLSTNLKPEDIEEYKKNGVEYIFPKPVNLKLFKTALDQSLKQSLSA